MDVAETYEGGMGLAPFPTRFQFKPQEGLFTYLQYFILFSTFHFRIYPHWVVGATSVQELFLERKAG